MANNQEQRRRNRAERKAAKKQAMLKPGAKSVYARKKAWLLANSEPIDAANPNGGRVHCWGFQVPEPKPWK
jgi:hypothetical protein